MLVSPRMCPIGTHALLGNPTAENYDSIIVVHFRHASKPEALPPVFITEKAGAGEEKTLLDLVDDMVLQNIKLVLQKEIRHRNSPR